MFAVANRWVNRLTYVFPTHHPWTANWNSSPSKDFQRDPSDGCAPGDLMSMHFRNGDWRTGILELRHCTKETLDRRVGHGGPLEPVIHIEPAVPFAFTPVPNFSFRGFTHMVVAQSPQYTPPGREPVADPPRILHRSLIQASLGRSRALQESFFKIRYFSWQQQTFFVHLWPFLLISPPMDADTRRLSLNSRVRPAA